LTRQIFQIVRRLSQGRGSLWDLIAACDGPIVRTYEACKQLVDEGLVGHDEEGIFVLTDKGRQSFAPALFEGFDQVFARYQQIVQNVPSVNTAYFQQRVQPQDLFRRLRFMYERGDIAGRSVFILGDDDYVSIALAMTGLPVRITVVEIDTRVTDFIQEKAARLGLTVEVAAYNAADALPANLAGKFDTFITDPVETPKGFAATMSRGIASLRHPGAIYFGITEIECPPERWHEFQLMFNRAGFVLTDILRDHSHYVDDPDIVATQFALFRKSPFKVSRLPDYRWYRSSFTRLISVRKPVPPIKGKIRFDKSFYEDDYVMTL
jgi:predicted methyltransferase